MLDVAGLHRHPSRKSSSHTHFLVDGLGIASWLSWHQMVTQMVVRQTRDLQRLLTPNPCRDVVGRVAELLGIGKGCLVV